MEEKTSRTLSEEIRATSQSPKPMPRHVSRLQWMNVPKNVRLQLAQDLKLRPSTHTEVASTSSGGIAEISDGFTERDLLALTPDLLKDYTNSSEEDFDVLWTLAVRKADILITSVAVPLDEVKIEPYIEPRKEKEVLVRLNKIENVIPKILEQPKKPGRPKNNG